MTLETYYWLGVTLRILCAFFWIATYLLVIRRGNQDRLPAMPLSALALNISWEGIFSFVYMPDDPLVLIAWSTCFFLDVAILVQVYRFGGNDFPNPQVRKHWTAILVVALLSACVLLLGFTAQFQDKLGWFTGFLQNLLMSVLFVAMLARRDSIQGQSLYIALGKFLGTLFAFVLAIHWAPAFGTAVVDHQLRAPTPMPALVYWIYPLIFFFDVLYIWLVYQQCRKEGINPWRRL
jgi:hypothetical protein